MSTVRLPPRAAVWLLHRLVAGRYADAIDGDLRELYQQDHSDSWYWRQVIMAIVILRANRLRMSSSRLTKGVVGGFALVALGIGTLSWSNSVRTDVDPRHPCSVGKASHAADCRVVPELIP